MKTQLRRDRVRLQSQMECLLEEMRIKLSSVVSDLLGASGLRILRALAAGETEPKKLVALGDDRLKCTEEQLVDALTGSSQPIHREMLALQLERLQLIDTQIAKLNKRPDYVNYPDSSPSPVVDYFLFVRYPFALAGKRWNSLQTRLARSSI